VTVETTTISIAGGIEVPLLVSAKMVKGFQHGFTTRAGGVSPPPFDSLNLGWKWGDRGECVDENHRRLLAVSGADSMFRASQIHGIRILRVRRGDDARAIAAAEADGLCSDEPGVGLSVHVADCTPIVLACPRTGACAVLHAGWRGTVAGMARAGVENLVSQFGCRPHDLYVALGPCIGACCFEVGPEVVGAFTAAMSAAAENGVVVRTASRKPHIDLRLFQMLQLEASGVPPENIDISTDCTFCDPGRRFYSFRKSGRRTGQLVGFVVRSGAPTALP
jgi:YfiH family protein